MRAVAVVVVDESTKHTLEVAPVEDQEPVDALRAGGADEALSDRIRLGRGPASGRSRCPRFAKTASKSRVNLLSRSRTRKRAGVDRSPSVQVNCRACWLTQAPLGVAVQPARCTRRLSSSMKKSTDSRCSRTVSTVKKSTASMLLRLRAQELTPGETGAPASRPESCVVEDLAHRGGRDRDAEPAQFAGDPLVAPTRVLERDAQHQRADLAINRRPARPTGIRPPSCDQPPVPAPAASPA